MREEVKSGEFRESVISILMMAFRMEASILSWMNRRLRGLRWAGKKVMSHLGEPI